MKMLIAFIRRGISVIVDLHGEIVDQELNSPFAYLRTLADEIIFPNSNAYGSDQIRLGAL